MNSLRFPPILPRQLASCVLLLVMVYQLGACPCGCLEHNSWLQLAGIVDHSRDSTAAIPSTASVTGRGAHDHDCTGEPRSPFIDNSRASTFADRSLESEPSALFVGPVWQNELVRVSFPLEGLADRQGIARTASRSFLQVYRL